MALFKTPSSGALYRPKPGQYLGDFKRHEDGPASAFADDNGVSKPTVRWVWQLFDLSGKPVLDSEGKPAEVDGLTSQSTGPKSKAYVWFNAHLGRNLQTGEDMEKASAECVGKRVMLLFIPSGDNQSRLSVVLPYSG